MRHLFYILVAMAVTCGAVACGKKHSPNSVKAEVQAVDAVARLVAVDSTRWLCRANCSKPKPYAASSCSTATA